LVHIEADTMDVYHVTHEDNVESIKEGGLEPSPSINHDYAEYVYVVPTRDDAEEVINAYYGAGNSVVIKATVAEHKLIDDPDPHGDLNSLAHNGHIPPRCVEVVA